MCKYMFYSIYLRTPINRSSIITASLFLLEISHLQAQAHSETWAQKSKRTIMPRNSRKRCNSATGSVGQTSRNKRRKGEEDSNPVIAFIEDGKHGRIPCDSLIIKDGAFQNRVKFVM